MCKKYAMKVFNYERYGYEFQDIVQEMEEKIYTALITYGETYGEYLKTGKYKPIQLEPYLKACMGNKVKDYIKKFNEESVENVDKISIYTNTFDVGEYNTMLSNLDFSNNTYVINDVDLCSGLESKSRMAFILFLKGFNKREIKKICKGVDVTNVISNQINFIKTKKKDILDSYRTKFIYQNIEE
jgi:hypothetical protein